MKSTDNEDILTKNFHVRGHPALSYNPQNKILVFLCTISIAFAVASAYTKRVNKISWSKDSDGDSTSVWNFSANRGQCKPDISTCSPNITPESQTEPICSQ